MRKKGVSLLILIISVIVLSILVTVSITGINGAISSAKKVTFTKELLEIKENAVAKLISKEALADFADTSAVYSKTRLSNTLTGEKKTQFDRIVNTDINDLIYKIDLKKLGVTSTEKGLGGASKTDESDFYYIQMSADKAYVKNIIYPKGIKAGKRYYFLLTKELLEDAEIPEQIAEPNDFTQTNTTAKVRLEKIDNNYTNEIKFKVNYDSTNDVTQLKIGDANSNVLNCYANISNGVTVWNKDTFKNLDISLINTVKVQLVNSQNNNMYTIADISNLDVEAPVISNISINKMADSYEIKVTATDDKSGIKNYRIVPTLKIGNEDYYILDKSIYTNKSTGDVLEPNYSRYVETYGEKSESNILHLPGDVVRFGVGVEDEAGNIAIKDFKI